MRYIFIPYNRFAAMELRQLDMDSDLSMIEQLQQVITASSPYQPFRAYWVERISIGIWAERRRFENVAMVVDEEGALKNLPMNHRASYIYGQPMHGRAIRGNAVIIGEGWKEVDDDGELIRVRDFMDLPEMYSVERLTRWIDTGEYRALMPGLAEGHPAGSGRARASDWGRS